MQCLARATALTSPFRRLSPAGRSPLRPPQSSRCLGPIGRAGVVEQPAGVAGAQRLDIAALGNLQRWPSGDRREPGGAERPRRQLDRPGARSATPEVDRPRPGQQRQPDPQRAGMLSLERWFRCTCYHPALVFNQFGDLESSAMRPGNLHSADGWRAVREPVVVRYRGHQLRRYFRADAASAAPEIYEFLEAKGFLYAIRLTKNPVLQASIAHLLRRSAGRPTICGGPTPASAIRPAAGPPSADGRGASHDRPRTSKMRGPQRPRPQIAAAGGLTGRPGPSEACFMRRADA